MKIIDVVAAFMTRNDRFFAAQRGEKMAHPLCWEFPGGKLESGETHREALSRELYEEFKIKAYPTDYIATRETIEPDRVIRVHLYKTLFESDNFVRTEHAQFQWLTLEEARERVWTQADKNFLDDIGPVIAGKKSVYEALPEDVFNNKIFSNVRIMYKHQIILGDTVKCFYRENNNCSIVEIKSNDEKTVHAIIELS